MEPRVLEWLLEAREVSITAEKLSVPPLDYIPVSRTLKASFLAPAALLLIISLLHLTFYLSLSPDPSVWSMNQKRSHLQLSS